MKKLYVIAPMLITLCFSAFGQWSNDPSVNNALSLTPGEQAIPKVATSENGITYIAWFSNEAGNYNVRLQKLDVFGEIQWAEGGLLVSDHQAMTWLTDWDMTVDQDDCAILTFQDIRNGDNDVFAYRIGSDSEFLWGENGIEMSTGPAFDAAPKVCITSEGNAVFGWQADEVIILQKISPIGEKLWGVAGITLSGPDTHSWPQLLPVGDDEVIIKYFEDSGPVWAPTRYVCAMRYDSDGNTLWDNPANVSIAGGISAWTQIFPFISDGNDGFYIAWHDDRDNNSLASVFVQHISSDGAVLFDENGIEATLFPGRNHFYPQLALPPGSADIFVYWNEMDADQNNRGLYGQKISATGERLWSDNAKKFIEIAPQDVYPYAAHNSEEDMVLFYEKNASLSNATIEAMRIDTAGNFVWMDEMVEVCSLPSTKVHTVSGAFHDGQWITAWEDDRNGNKDIYAQNLKLDGTPGPVFIPTNLTITPDSVICDEYGPNYAYVINNTPEEVTINDVYYELGWYVYFQSLPGFPYILAPGDSLAIEIYVSPGSSYYNPGYEYDALLIDSELGIYSTVVAINWDLLGGYHKIFDKNTVHVFPNPAKTIIYFDIDANLSNDAVLKIYTTSGMLIKTFDNINSGKISWNLTNEIGQKVAPGIYIFRLYSDLVFDTGKISIRDK